MIANSTFSQFSPEMAFRPRDRDTGEIFLVLAQFEPGQKMVKKKRTINTAAAHASI